MNWFWALWYAIGETWGLRRNWEQHQWRWSCWKASNFCSLWTVNSIIRQPLAVAVEALSSNVDMPIGALCVCVCVYVCEIFAMIFWWQPGEEGRKRIVVFRDGSIALVMNQSRQKHLPSENRMQRGKLAVAKDSLWIEWWSSCCSIQWSRTLRLFIWKKFSTQRLVAAISLFFLIFQFSNFFFFFFFRLQRYLP